ncbi:MAG: glycosyltransferase family 2 protein [Methylobacter sp.]|uniref:glycosyltransferase family 2 protein n=1 Tax=Methylobacter sp. TaxID=2051955 RepID=UPI002731FB7E|nr:glycosyltransferase family 2 protein [Methylobacter sp.]MDP1666443.1 glycosyltransferase family 2 protein [Methylobacter sp.]
MKTIIAASVHSAINNDPDCKLNCPSQPHKEEGGLRSQGIYKHSLPGKPLITVITVVFNGAETLRDTIESVMKQSYNNIEHIVIDGGSSDATVDILKQHDHIIDYWVSEKDGGIYDAMNKGISLCSGEYVGMLNSDDMFSDENALQVIADRFCMAKVDAVFSGLNIVDKKNIKKILRKYRVAKLNSVLLRIGVMPPHPTFYCKKSCYEEGGMYKTNYKIAADFEMLVRLLIKQKISWSFIDKVMVTMRSGGLSNSGFITGVKLNCEIVRACKENGLYTNLLFLALKLPIRLLELIR